MGNKKDSLGDRIKEKYENKSQTYLLRRTPVIIRLDGCRFHSYTKGFAKPFDERFIEAMQRTTQALCQSIYGCVFGYTQSDEISLVLVDYQHIGCEAWYDYSVQKLCSVSAAMCTLFFNKVIEALFTQYCEANEDSDDEQVQKLINTYETALKKRVACFDAKAFNVPEVEVVNAILWRQNDAIRNSVASLAQAHFSHKELHGKNTNQMQDMLMEKYGINWNELDICKKWGSAVIWDDEGRWVIDKEMPILRGCSRSYLENLIHFDEDD